MGNKKESFPSTAAYPWQLPYIDARMSIWYSTGIESSCKAAKNWKSKWRTNSQRTYLLHTKRGKEQQSCIFWGGAPVTSLAVEMPSCTGVCWFFKFSWCWWCWCLAVWLVAWLLFRLSQIPAIPSDWIRGLVKALG